ncbi:heavy metal translocating P-type ATPase [Clostridium luticellarii]|jgi:heavy metal translocating P-type ATPase|uniref:Cd(2+)-exporting ATPase n=1 Tax=Clostridium luticellarii TaxID=1691940 RepID=A0A2T0BRL3_9CLOT|nr:cation-translocating P-type ATPase [Clostridium luticellarii]MCI1943808.1 cation-translocating P-type ATPase [Clostridium luticellarii]MCI1967069.1 cation-translocating P-type ATPase [Clostridium luticellarii]MCI1994436.1 cation-translocating P-type ATPase [Clostridium luticellarii]PRR86485.1 putative cadmium-transporting ATPase [Clostridium luticellarii]
MKVVDKFRKEKEFCTLCLTIISGIFLFISFFKLIPQLPFDAAWIAIIISGIPIIFGAIKGLLAELDVTADLLVAIALIAALVIEQYFAAGEVAFIMQLGSILEDFTAKKSHKSLQSLINLTPQKACLHTSDGDMEILASEVKKGDILLIRPGESIPVDGRIIKGTTSIDQSIMTGESIPVDKTIGDEVYQGTINEHGVIKIEASNVGDDSSLKKMINLVKKAEENKAPIVRIADKWARILVPVALGCSILILIITRDIHRAVTALVVFCPCSLILATPTAIMAAIGNATKKGILIKSGSAVETAAKLDTIVMDKTGTLTYGKLRVENIVIFHDNIHKEDFIKLVASAEKFSEHPLGRAILKYSHQQGITAKDPDLFKMQAGKGVRATVEGHEILIGIKIIGQELIDSSPEISELVEETQKSGKTVLPVALDGTIIGIVSIADALRREAKLTISELKKVGISHLVMLTGDNEAVANSIGQSVNMTDIFASQLPEDKADSIKKLMDEGHSVGMLGDGVNDAPALATASVGIVMGAIGSDVAIETADIALMSDDIGKLPFLIKLCRKTKNRILFNITISMFINFCAIILAGFGILNPITAALVHNCGSVFVVVNSALLLTYKDEANPKYIIGREKSKIQKEKTQSVNIK